MWNAGWSHGREKLGDKPDLAKGSFYFNPLYDQVPVAAETKEKYPFAFPDNLWPKEEIPELEGACKALGTVMFSTIVLLSKAIDNYISSKIPSFEKGKFHNTMKTTMKIKGRLLYYYPCNAHDAEDGWIGWHNDSGFLTGLVSSQYFNDDTGEKITNPDPQGGLWVVNRGSTPVKISFPPDQMAVQCGECLQIISGGLLVATPHAVRASNSSNGVRIGRAACPMFVDTDVEYKLAAPPGIDKEQVFDKTVHSRVPPLQKRWKGNDQTFVEFLGDTFRQYYEWNGTGGM
jgi:isopenicillin N synthase-like dioxygenase